MRKLALAFVVSTFTFGCGQAPKLKSPLAKVERKYHINKEQAVEKQIESEKEQVQTSDVFLDRSAGKVYYVGLLVPLTGKFAGIGQQVLESVMLAVYSSDYGQIRIVPLDTESREEGARLAAQRAISMNVDVVLGPVFSSEAKAVKNILQVGGIKAISLSNDATVASEDIYVFGVLPEALMTTVLTFSKQAGKHNYGVILPSSEYGYTMGKNIENMLSKLEMFSMAVEFYPRNRALFNAVANRIFLSRKRSYKIREDGSLYTNNRRDRSKRAELDDELPIVEKSMDALYLDAKGADLDAMLYEINRVGIDKAGIQVFASDLTTSWSERFDHRMEGVMFPSVASSSIISAEYKFQTQTGRKPTRISLLAYDAVSTIVYAFRKYGVIGKHLYLHNGYNGILGDFRFLKNGLVQRRFGIYTIRAGHPELVYTSPLFI